ncbi:NADH-quinone oxidoreductase subunit K [Colwellia sp. D2M02]|uniref:Na+/H+ antiporter subunit C n=1 Tax=Colwellia asteriadis TaxID=517723 RepID=A0ABN1L3P9_9GAMM|nr:NADH-quinone oxidoreductase subunit K [Colwellia sp. D2M02]MBU2891811.1 NADH-quinone oxidoreductase subunit K [Colwellia sp. D2M02]
MELTQTNLYTLCAILLLAIGLLGFLLNTDFIRKVLGLNIIGIAIFMLLLAVANTYPAAIDPIPHAMVLTGIIVAAAGTALGLNLASKIAKFSRIVQKEEVITSAESLSDKAYITSPNNTQERG